MRPGTSRCGDRSRAQSEVVGVVLVLGMVLAGATTVVVFGASAFADSQAVLSAERAEKAMTQVDSKAALVALGNTDGQQVSIASRSGESMRVSNTSGYMRITIDPATSSPETLMNQSLGSILWENDRTTVAYQGGGVWRTSGPGSVMVSPPEFHYRNGTLTLPVLKVNGTRGVRGNVGITYNDSRQYFPDGETWENPLDRHRVEVTVKSDYYEAWGRYFEERTDGEAEYDHSEQTATLELVAPSNHPSVGAGMITGATGSLEVGNAEVDSYNSSIGPYAGGSPNSRVVAAGDVDLNNGAVLRGDVELDGELTAKPNAQVDGGNISHVGGSAINSCTDSRWLNCGDRWVNSNASVETPDPAWSLIDTQRRTFEDGKGSDNAAAGDVDNGTNTLSSCSTCRLENGTYYLDHLDLSGRNLVLDTSSGKVDIVVDGNATNVERIDVEGDGRANLYLNGDFETVNNFEVGNLSTDDATQLWIYMPDDKEALLGNGGNFVGVIYGPGGELSEGVNIDIGTGGMGGGGLQIYGALVGNIRTQVNNADIHYDEALSSADTVIVSDRLPKVTYLHVTTNWIDVE